MMIAIVVIIAAVVAAFAYGIPGGVYKSERTSECCFWVLVGWIGRLSFEREQKSKEKN